MIKSQPDIVIEADWKHMAILRSPPACPNRHHHGIDFKNPFTMSKRAVAARYRCADAAELVSSSLETVGMVEPIGIEPMT